MRTRSRQQIIWLVEGPSPSTALAEAIKSIFDRHRLKVWRSWHEMLEGKLRKPVPLVIFTEAIPQPESVLKISQRIPGIKIIGITAYSAGQSEGLSAGSDLLKFLSQRAQVLKFDRGLTPSEKKVLQLMVKGFIKKEIAERLSLSFHTVNNRERKIYEKLNVHTRPAAVAKALMEGLV